MDAAVLDYLCRQGAKKAAKAWAKKTKLSRETKASPQLEAVFEAGMAALAAAAKQQTPPQSPSTRFSANGDDSDASSCVSESSVLSASEAEPEASVQTPPEPVKTEEADKSTKTGGKRKRDAKQERFQRVKADDVQFRDDRLRDNTYMTNVGDQSDYGFKAHKDLIVTRGKGFRTEKNKKKRGSYRGGAISIGTSKSVKFQYSDDE